MAGQQRVYRQRIRSVQATKKITRAMELIAASRVVKARSAVAQSTPYAVAMTRACSAVAGHSQTEHLLLTERKQVKRAAVLICTSDRGLAGSYSVNAIKQSGELIERLTNEGKEVVPFLVGRKGVSYFKFRRRDFAAEWTGFTDKPDFATAKEIGERLVDEFTKGSDEGGVDEVHIVYTQFKSMVTQEPRDLRLLPLDVVEGDEELEDEQTRAALAQGPLPLYDFEPSAEEALDALLPKYVAARVYNCLLQAAASELAARQRAMKSATDNAEELIKTYTRLANQARQAEITQEISEIVGGASALAEA
jgi:F-type H+-transporting ATPase subunit gamma